MTTTSSPATTAPATAAPAPVHEQDLDPILLLAATDPDAMNALNADLVAIFRARSGDLDGAFAGVPLLVLTTTGAPSGTARTTPLNYTRAGAGYVVVASKSGAPTHPDWYRNLHGHLLGVQARIVAGAERRRLFDRHTAVLPHFAVYQHRTTRRLPVLVLEPIS